MLRLGKRLSKHQKASSPAMSSADTRFMQVYSEAVNKEVTEKLKLGYRVSGLVNGKMVVLNDPVSKKASKLKKKR